MDTPPKAKEAPKVTPTKHFPNWVWGLIIAVFAVVGLLVAAGVWYTFAVSPKDPGNTTRQAVTLESGVNAAQIAKILKQEDLIRDELAFSFYTQITGTKDKLQAGSYRLAQNQSVAQIVEDLIKGKTDAFNVTILPGQTLAEIKTTLVKAGFEGTEIDAAFAKKYDHPLLSSKPNRVSLEGYIFPETYQVDSSTTAESLIVRTFDHFKTQLDKHKLSKVLKARSFNLHEAIILASIIQEEVPTAAEQAKVAQVFLKRLKIGMVLGSDPTFIYGASQLNVEPSPSLKSPYNTRIHKGLPPSAIANFNLSALVAVAKPARSNYLYFVAGDNGKTYFSRTVEEHEANVVKHCHILCN